MWYWFNVLLVNASILWMSKTKILIVEGVRQICGCSKLDSET
jgi:hypothetical protein